jgi:hypothetical protein
MKLHTITKRYFMLAASAFFLVSAFQNCGQPGSIAVADAQKVTDLNDGEVPPPPPPPVIASYKDYGKDLVVNQSTNKVDVLVIVDNSGSMSLEQSNMATRFNTFLSKLQGLDWQVGIVTTDMRTDSKNSALKDGRLLYFSRLKSYLIKSTDPIATAQTAFAETVQRPASEGSGNEQGIAAAYRALERATSNTAPNVGLIRPGAALSIILVTDSDETVAGNENTGDVTTFGPKNMPDLLLNYVKTNLPGKTFKYNSIIVRDNDLACLNLKDSGNEAYGKNYQKMTNLTSGVLGNVCESDYGNQLSVIGDNTTEQIKVVPLDCAPVDKDANGVPDLIVKNGAGTVVTNYVLSGRMVTFDANLPVGSYKFTYTCLIQ